MAHNRIRTFNKYVTNRVLHNFARLSRGPFAVIRHVGRRSGKQYETTIMVEQLGDRFVIALTYGPEVDWYRNIVAAGRCTLLWHGKEYTLEKPEPLAMQTALPAFSRLQRPILRLVGVQHFVSMKYQEGALAPATGGV